MINVEGYRHFCIGCGLCPSERGIPFSYDEKGFPTPVLAEKDVAFCQLVCPAGSNTEAFYQDGIWGPLLDVCGGWAKDKELRHQASSGGVLTALALWLLEHKVVDGIIQTRPSQLDPLKTETICSRTKAEVESCIGSRYSIATPLADLSKMMKTGEKYAVVGRPCDILALKKYQQETNKYQDQILFTLSFFCAGTPSDTANLNLLKAMGCAHSDCATFNYRGNGWPGSALASDYKGVHYSMNYAESWGQYLGRDLRPMCRVCMDGTGAAADISCGDYWQLENGRPDFDEHEGRNLIFVRTEAGKRLLESACQAEVLEVIPFVEGRENIHLIQPAQYERTTTMLPRVLAMKMLGRKTPEYSLRSLKRLSKHTSFKKQCRVFAGTVKRICQGRI